MRVLLDYARRVGTRDSHGFCHQALTRDIFMKEMSSGAQRGKRQRQPRQGRVGTLDKGETPLARETDERKNSEKGYKAIHSLVTFR